VPDAPEKAEEVARETARGRSERTPWLALGGVHLVVGLVFAVVVTIVLLVYLLN
jgi:hypothetical protein